MKTILIMLFTAVSICAFAQDTTVTQIEYFFDSDYGIGNNTVLNVTPAADGMFPFTASITNLSVGYHKLYIRTKDSNGKWSQTARRNVEVFTPDAKVNMVSGEYFIDTDTGFGAGMPIVINTPDSVVLQNFTAVTSALSVGYHKLYGRLKDNLGRWSQTFRRNIEVYKNDTNYITKVEYFFKIDNGYGNCTEVALANPSVDGTFSFNIPLSNIPAGADTLFIRAGDSSENKWSLTTLKNTKDTSGVLPLTLIGFNVAKQGATAQVIWQTANEVNTSYFNIERSLDGRNFTSVGKVTAKGNDRINNDYSFTDDVSQLPPGKIFYRLEIRDKDGKFTYSTVKYIDISNTLRLLVMPNPVHGNNLALAIYSPENDRLGLMVYNEMGKVVFIDNFIVPAGNLNKHINFINLAAGVYFVKMSNKVSTVTARFVKE